MLRDRPRRRRGSGFALPCLGALALLGLSCAVGGHDPRPADHSRASIQIDAETRATPRRLRGPLQVTRVSSLEALSFDPRRQSFAFLSYELSRPAWMRIRVVGRRDPRLLLRTLVDWAPRRLGVNRERWDGRDASDHWLDRGSCPGRFVIEGDSPEHTAHDRSRCTDWTLPLDEPSSHRVIAGNVPITIAGDGLKRGYIGDSGGWLRLYVDCEETREWPVPPGRSRSLTVEWDSAAVEDGHHLLTLNLADHYDHLGTASIRISIDNADVS